MMTSTRAGIDENEEPVVAAKTSNDVVVLAKCECCALTEEYTEEYVSRVRQRHGGRWVCGLCGEAVKDEIGRSEKKIGYEEALSLHMSFCNNFRSSTPAPHDRADQLISTVKQLLLRRLDSDSPRSSPSMNKAFLRSRSCVPAFDA